MLLNVAAARATATAASGAANNSSTTNDPHTHKHTQRHASDANNDNKNTATTHQHQQATHMNNQPNTTSAAATPTPNAHAHEDNAVHATTPRQQQQHITATAPSTKPHDDAAASAAADATATTQSRQRRRKGAAARQGTPRPTAGGAGHGCSSSNNDNNDNQEYGYNNGREANHAPTTSTTPAAIPRGAVSLLDRIPGSLLDDSTAQDDTTRAPAQQQQQGTLNNDQITEAGRQLARDNPRRVKIYELNQAGQWDDRGTGRVYLYFISSHAAVAAAAMEQGAGAGPKADDGGPPRKRQRMLDGSNNNAPAAGNGDAEDAEPASFDSPLKDYRSFDYPSVPGEVVICVLHEHDASELISHVVDAGVNYERQGDTIITWCEDSSDLALSFQEKDHCQEVWNQIGLVQDAVLNNEDDSAMAGGAAAGGSDGGRGHYRGSLGSEEEGDSFGESPFGAYSYGRRSMGMSADMLPPPLHENLDRIADLLSKSSVAIGYEKEAYVMSLVQDDYIAQLLDVFESAEAKNDRDSCFCLFTIVQSIFLLNNVGVMEILLSNEHVMRVIAALEYDPSLPPEETDYHRHRKFLGRAVFRRMVGIEDFDLLAKIQQNYRLAYIRDVILLRYLEDAILNTLNSMFFFNNVAIINRLASDLPFLNVFFANLHELLPMGELEVEAPRMGYEVEDDLKSHGRSADDSTISSTTRSVRAAETAAAAGNGSDHGSLDEPFPWQEMDMKEKDVLAHTGENRRAMLQFLQELCNISKPLQVLTRENFFKVLIKFDIFEALGGALVNSEPSSWVWLAVTDILTAFVSHDPEFFSGYLVTERGNALLQRLCAVVVAPDVESGLSHQVLQILKMLVDAECCHRGIWHVSFVSAFFNVSVIGIVTGALERAVPASVTKTEEDLKEQDYLSSTNQALSLLSFCLYQYPAHMVPILVSRQVIERVTTLLREGASYHAIRRRQRDHTDASAIASPLKKRDMELSCACMRFLRSCIGTANENLVRLVTGETVDVMMQVFEENGARYNVLNSVICEFVQHVVRNNMTGIIAHIANNHQSKFRDVTYVPVFDELMDRHKRNQELEQQEDDVPGSYVSDAGQSVASSVVSASNAPSPRGSPSQPGVRWRQAAGGYLPLKPPPLVGSSDAEIASERKYFEDVDGTDGSLEDGPEGSAGGHVRTPFAYGRRDGGVQGIVSYGGDFDEDGSEAMVRALRDQQRKSEERPAASGMFSAVGSSESEAHVATPITSGRAFNSNSAHGVESDGRWGFSNAAASVAAAAAAAAASAASAPSAASPDGDPAEGGSSRAGLVKFADRDAIISGEGVDEAVLVP